MAVISENSDDMGWKEVGRTEMIKNTLDPDFTKIIKLEYHFEMCQKIRFDVYDVDKSVDAPLSSQDFIGTAEILLSDIVIDREGHYTDDLTKDGKNRGKISVFCEEDRGNENTIKLKLRGEKLDKKDLFGKSDPYYILYKKMPDCSFSKVYQSETIMKTLNPTWKEHELRVWDLCNGQMDQDIKVECYDWDRYSSDDLIGEAYFTLEKVTGTDPVRSLELINKKYTEKKKKYTNSGKLYFDKAEIVVRHSFIEYLRGGLDVNVIVAIDFTLSNRYPTSPNSLHYIRPDGNNAYMQAIWSVGSILAAYDRDQRIPVFGYGAELPDGNVYHCFPLGGNMTTPEVLGIQGVMDAYQNALRTVKLSGPTIFAQVINAAAEIARLNMEVSCYKYFVLLILTDGEINDIRNTIDAIVAAANDLPLSIVIVGIGNANFSSMDRLDADDNPLVSSKGVTAKRDIVQFVPFNKYADDPHRLAQETLAEIPGQITQTVPPQYQPLQIPVGAVPVPPPQAGAPAPAPAPPPPAAPTDVV